MYSLYVSQTKIKSFLKFQIGTRQVSGTETTFISEQLTELSQTIVSTDTITDEQQEALHTVPMLVCQGHHST